MDVKPYPPNPKYLVSKEGQIYAAKTMQALKPQRVHGDYLYVRLSCGSSKSYKGVHQMVALTWLDNPNQYKEVNHLDFDKTNNAASNLEWCSRKHNVRHAAIGNKGSHKLDFEKVEHIKRLHASGLTFTAIALQFSVSRQAISAVIKGKSWS